jgi:hypothetical protein
VIPWDHLPFAITARPTPGEATMNIGQRAYLSLSLVLLAGCASAKHQPAGMTDNVITRRELEAAGSVTTYDAVQRLRPYYLRDRGAVTLVNGSAHTRPVVFIDMQEYGEVESLRTLQASRVEQVRFFPGQQAVTTFGSTYGAGVIQLTMRVQ